VPDRRVVQRHQRVVGVHAGIDLDPSEPRLRGRAEGVERVLTVAVDDPSAEPPMAAQHRWIGEDRARHHAVAWHAMPLLSFVLAVHGEQGYLEECAASILGPGVDDLELVAIDDASPDHAPALLDRLAA